MDELKYVQYLYKKNMCNTCTKKKSFKILNKIKVLNK